MSSFSEGLLKKSKLIRTINFEENSEFRTINKNAFFGSSLVEIEIPQSVIELKEGWCCGAFKLDKVTVDLNNPNFSFINYSFLVGKSDSKSDVFDVLLFARRKLIEADIPSYIKRISSYAFEGCKQLNSISFQENSLLTSIGEYSFSNSSITTISFSSEVREIGDYSFYNCTKLKEICFPNHSKLESIGKNAFSNSSLETLSMPFLITSNDLFKNGWCCQTLNLNNISILKDDRNQISYFNDSFIIGKSDSKSDIFDFLLFARRDIENANIPKFIKRIG